MKKRATITEADALVLAVALACWWGEGRAAGSWARLIEAGWAGIGL